MWVATELDNTAALATYAAAGAARDDEGAVVLSWTFPDGEERPDSG